MTRPGQAPKRPRWLCAFAGSSDGAKGAYAVAARELGRHLAENDIGLVYGGAKVGLMGSVADAVLAAGGRVIGVIPQALVQKEIAHPGLTELRIVASMHERKALMAKLSDGFIALPGGIGTLEEIFEIWTWAQLGSHAKPCALLNVSGFYDGLLAFLDHVAAEGFLKHAHRGMLVLGEEPETLVEAMLQYEAPHVSKWIARSPS